MEFDVQTERELKELIRFRMNKEVDDEYIQLLAEIMNIDPVFYGKIVIERTGIKQGIITNYQDNKIFYNLEFLKKEFSRRYSIFQRCGKFDSDLTHFCGYWLPFCFIHEVAHVYQLLCSRDSISKYSEVNDLYRKIYHSFNEFRNIDRMVYTIFYDKYCIERNANFVASNFLVDVFDETELEFFSKLSQINYLFRGGYSLKRKKVISPVERTFKYLKIEDKLENVDLPFEVLFEHGFKIADNDFYFLYDGFLKDKRHIKYYETIEKVKTLTKGDIHN